MTDTLKQCRDKLDQLDDKLCELLNQRACIAKEVGAIKRQEAEVSPFYRPERESEIIRRLTQTNPGPLAAKELTDIFRPILGACLAIQHPLKVAFLGPEGTYSHQACNSHFGSQVSCVQTSSIEDVFRLVASDGASYGVVPLESESQGIIMPTLNALIETKLNIIGEVNVDIDMSLLRRAGDDAPLRRVYGHTQGFAQCSHWVANSTRHLEKVLVDSNAEAARRASLELGAGAISSARSAKHYELEVIQANIHDTEENKTRFVVLGKQLVAQTGNDKTSLLIYTNDEPGTLLTLLLPFKERGINLSLIESKRYPGRQWDYVFIVDALAHQQDDAFADVLRQLHQLPIKVAQLGSYPVAH